MPGDRVRARSEFDPTGPIEAKVVEAKFVRMGRILHLHFPDGELIRTTPEHPFFVYDKGWTAAGALKAGDRVATRSGEWVPVAEVFDTEQWETVYNVRVADFHTYFVGEEAWGWAAWAHNLYHPLFNDDGGLFSNPPALPAGPHGVQGVNYNPFTPVAGTNHPLAPPVAGGDPFANPRGFALFAVNEIRSYFTSSWDAHSVTSVAVVRVNGAIPIWVSGSGDDSQIAQWRRAVLYHLNREAGYTATALPVYRVINPQGTNNANRQNDAERHILREIAASNGSVQLLAIASTLRICRDCQQALVAQHLTAAIAVPTGSGGYLTTPNGWREQG